MHKLPILATVKKSFELLATQLTVSNLISSNSQAANIVSQHRADVFEDASDFNFENYLWAHTIIVSRSWSLGSDVVLVPMVDMLNHNDNGGEVNADTQFSVISRHDTHVGDPVYYKYGSKSNFELLSLYGFILDENPSDSLHIIVPSLKTVDSPVLQPFIPFEFSFDAIRCLFAVELTFQKQREHSNNTLQRKTFGRIAPPIPHFFSCLF